MQLDNRPTALVIVDMQNAFCNDKGSMVTRGFDITGLKKPVEPCIRLAKAARAAGVPVIQTQYVRHPDYVDAGLAVRELMPGALKVASLHIGSWDAAIIPELGPDPHDVIITKNRPSAFFSTQLESFLNAMKIENLVVCGVTTNMCVETTVRDAAQRDYRVFVAEDAVGEVDPKRHTMALRAMAHMFATLTKVDDVLEVWRGRNAQTAA
jgi:ureidoacrylate peracid hydrolase